MRTLKEQLEHLQTHHPKKLHKIITKLKEDYGEEIEDYFFCHIMDRNLYDTAVAHFKNFNGTQGAHWTPEVIKMKANINFDEKEYTCLDFAYMANKIYSHIGDMMSEEHIFKYTKRLLEDKDYYGDASERSYHDAMEILEYYAD